MLTLLALLVAVIVPLRRLRADHPRPRLARLWAPPIPPPRLIRAA
jgi:hypothetical protein